jgi:hydroxymethylbilane synthase
MGLAVPAMPQRADPLDAIVGGKPQDLKYGATVGTSPLRRTAKLMRVRLDLNVQSIRWTTS